MAINGLDQPVLTIYVRNYCHLCDDMITALRDLQGRFVFQIEVMDVDTNAELESRYGENVPVLTYDGRELCHYFLDTTAVTAFLGKFR